MGPALLEYISPQIKENKTNKEKAIAEVFVA